ncbi:glycosyltransferase [Cytobacillus suaedae]|nr:glycosyltransferase [Cytobacillus suaedae]
MSYILSLIVPTKNRYTYLKSIIKTFNDSLDNGEVELIIQDNSDNNEEILDFLGKGYSEHIKYCYYKDHMTVSDNFSKGIQNSSGNYVCMIGDDDTISSKIVEIVEYMIEKDIESAIFNKAKYNWPDMEFRAHKIPSLTVPKFTGKIITIDPEEELKKCLRQGATSLLKLPEIYHGIVKRTTLDKIFDRCNTYFPGASPDMAIAIALSLIVKSHIYVDAPYTFSGQAYVSAGGKGARHQHKNNLKGLSWLPNDIEEKWESDIPMIWTGPTIYAESALKALRAMGREDLIENFNYLYHYAMFSSFNSEYKNMLSPYLKGSSLRKIKYYNYKAKIFTIRLKRYIKNIITTRIGWSSDLVYKNISSTDEASKVVDKLLSCNKN